MKFVVLLFLTVLFAAPSLGQVEQSNVCNLTLAQAPALYNLRLGMSPDAVQVIFGRELKIKIKKNGNRVFFQNFIKKPAPPVLSGVKALYLRFFDRRLYQIEIFYEDRPEIKTVEDFTRNLSASWQNARGRQTVNCAEFTVAADKILNPRVELTDTATLAKAEEFLAQQAKKKQ